MTAEKRRRELYVHLACLLVLAVLVAIAFSDVLGPDRGLFYRDHALFFRRRWRFVVESILEGRLPAFDPLEPSGVPFETILNGTYTPTSLVFLLGSFDFIYDLHVALIVFVLGAGAYGLARTLEVEPRPAVVAAAIAMLSGPVISFENLLMGLEGLAYAPWVYWAIVALFQRPSLAKAGALGAALGFHLQEIMPEVLVLDILAFLVMVAVIRPPARPRTVLLLFVGAGLGLFISAVELFPVLEVLPTTARGRGFSYPVMSAWSLSPAQLLELFLPGFWSPLEDPMIRIPSIVGERGYPYLNSLYFGSSLPLCALAALRRPSRRFALAILFIVLVALLVAAGPRTPLHRAMSAVPILKSARYPVKYLLLFAASMAVLAPMGWRTFEEQPLALAFAAGVQCALLSSLVWVIGSSEFLEYLRVIIRDDPQVRFVQVSAADYPSIARAAMHARAVYAAIFAGGLTLVAIAAAVVQRARPYAGTVAAGILVLDLAMAARFVILGASLEPRGPPDDVLARIADGTSYVYPVAPNGIPPRVAHEPGRTYFEDKVISNRRRGVEDMPNVRYLLDIDADGASNRTHALAFGALKNLRGKEAERLLARLGVRWLIIPVLSDVTQGAVKFDVPGEAPEYLVPVQGARPYVRAYPRWRSADLMSTSVDALIADLSSESDPDTALVFSEIAPPQTAGECRPMVTRAPDAPPGSVTLEVDSGCRSVVVVLEIFVPGWTAKIDGGRIPIFSAEAGFIGMEVQPGKHHVELFYEPRLERWAWLSAGAFAAAVLLVTSGLLRSSSRRAS